jgi:citrate lyase beta subunit
MTRSLLFVPGDSGRKFDHAAASAADALILDLEDSVAPDQKPAARKEVRAMLERGAAGKQLWVRINALDGGDPGRSGRRDARHPLRHRAAQVRRPRWSPAPVALS